MVVGMACDLKLCGSGLRPAYHAHRYGQAKSAFERPCVVILIYTAVSNRRQEFVTGRLSNLASVSDIELMIADHPQLLEFHGISSQELEVAQVSGREVAYLLSSFTAGRMYYSADKARSVKPFERESYRYSMLKSPQTRRAWPIIRKMMEPDSYRDKIDITIQMIEEEYRLKQASMQQEKVVA